MASSVWSGTASYDPFELEFSPSTNESIPYVAHRKIKLLQVTHQLEALLYEKLEDARHANSTVVIRFSGKENTVNNTSELDRIFRLTNQEPENQRYEFDYRDIKYNKKMLFGSDIIQYRIGETWEEIKIISRELMEGLINQIDFAKKYKKRVSVNLNLLEDSERQEFVKPLSVISILPS